MPLDATAAIDSTTWAALALVLTLIAGALSVVAWRRRGPAAGLRGLAWTLVPVAAWLTGTLRLATAILDDVLGWAARLVFSPVVWLGVVVAGVSGALFVVSGVLKSRGIGTRGRARDVRRADAKQVRAPKGRQVDELDDLSDIEAILKKHGI